MRLLSVNSMRALRHRVLRLRARVRVFGRDRRGTTAIEMAFVFTPFLMLLFGIMGVGLFYFTETVLDQALTAASRQIRTGESQSTPTGAMTVGNFRTEICSQTAGLIDCSKLSIIIDNKADWNDVSSIPSCVDNNGAVVGSKFSDATSVASGAGGRSAIVTIVLCYPWALAGNFPFLNLGNVNGGSARLIQSALVFRSEPY